MQKRELSNQQLAIDCVAEPLNRSREAQRDVPCVRQGLHRSDLPAFPSSGLRGIGLGAASAARDRADSVQSAASRAAVLEFVREDGSRALCEEWKRK